ncbi:Bardet-Biedl syndrome 2 protein homolog isoform X1 [Sipha flava]|uniref:Bardet-Biedl syndrome 2 protein homolog n=2 Tax=Sipha flava TaxID=143950 RepID=A0A8B8FGG8_9HEMI|nr:Bardet-Biedl syndrome 2 protein homolog isoform X1 [Sipha flava]
MAVPLFSLQLRHSIIPRLVTIGKYDGSHYCVTAATSENKILIHSPHKPEKDISYLNINQKITALLAGKAIPNDEKDILVVGTVGSVLAYNVDLNSDLFYKEIPDGVAAISIGKLSSMKDPAIIIGGNCSIQAFDYKGNEILWTVTGDNVRSIIVMDVDLDGSNEILVGSDDYEIREFKDDIIVNEISETSSICSLIHFSPGRFAYALDNGTVGVYDKFRRVWRVKSKSSVNFLEKYDLDGDGKEELITGWSNGKVDARNSITGEVIFRDVLSTSIAGIVVGDYRRAGKCQMIVISTTGEVRGYDNTSLKVESGVQTNVVHDLLQKRQILMAELNNYTKASHEGHGIPGDTRLITEVSVSEETIDPCVLLKLSTNNSMILKAVTIFAEGIFEDETQVIHPKRDNVSSELNISLIPPKDILLDIHIRAFVGSSVDIDQFHVFELTRQLPKFSMYLLVNYPENEDVLQSYVKFRLVERVQRLDLWLSQNFIVPQTTPVKSDGQHFWKIAIKSLRDSSLTCITFEKEMMSIFSENINLTADIIQSLASYLNLDQIDSLAEFPKVLDDLWRNMQTVKTLQQNSIKLNTSIADSSTLLKNLIVQAEDFRLLNDVFNMEKCLNEIYLIDKQMIQNHQVTCENHEQLLATLKKINTIIQNASRIRVNNNKTEIITTYRQAVASENMTILKKLIESGNK